MTNHIYIGWRKIMHGVWSVFLNGLFTILPLTLTISLFKFSLHLLKGWLEPIHNMIQKTVLGNIPHSEIIIVILVIFLVGIVLKNFILLRVLHAVEALIFKIPLVRPVYSGIKQLVSAFNIKDSPDTIKQVVLAEFPRNGLYSIGFLTGQLPPELAPTQDKRYFNIFIPTTPNPTTGFFIIIPEEQIINVHLTRQEAMALVISGGIILPDQFIKKANI